MKKKTKNRIYIFIITLFIFYYMFGQYIWVLKVLLLRGVKGNRSGAPEEIRTPDPRFRKPLLYPTELQAHWSG